jgi:hypothetical protein
MGVYVLELNRKGKCVPEKAEERKRKGERKQSRQNSRSE